MNTLEKQYFCLLVELARCGTPKLRNYINQKLKQLKEENENLSHRTGKKKIEPGIREQLYYSNWIYSAVHILTLIPDYQNIEAISQHLGVNQNKINEVLCDLERHQFVVNKGNR